jgi:transitional endoplasmic reticulum ATPase
MDPASSVSYARSLITLAEKKEGAEKRQLYLEASEHYLQAAKATTGQEKQYYLNEAKKLYDVSQTIVIEENKGMDKPRTRFRDVAGLEKVKEDIMIKIIEPLRHPEIFQHFGKKAGGGILMYGPPGCGKSLIAEATAGEAEVAFFNVKASDIKSKYVGEAEQRLSKLFSEARKEKASIIFFDEFEALGGERSRMTRPMKAVVSQLLTEMDGVGNKEQNILVIGATNEPWNIDTALRREGRFGTTIFIPPPDKHARLGIMKLHMEKRPVEENIDYGNLADRTENFSGADMKALCERATEIPLKECLKFNVKRNINSLDFQQALHGMKPTTQPWFRNSIKRIKELGEAGNFPEIMDFEKQVFANPCRMGA